MASKTRTAKDKIRDNLIDLAKSYGLGKDSKVFTLLGGKCLELPGYMALGVEPKNIFTVERSLKVRKELLRNAPEVHFYPGTFRGLMKHARCDLHTTFDWSWADFNSTFWDYRDEMMALLPLVAESRLKTLAITSYAMRDHRFVMASRVAHEQVRRILGSGNAELFTKDLSHNCKLVLGDEESEPEQSNGIDERLVGFVWWLALALETTSLEVGKRISVCDYRSFRYKGKGCSTMMVWFLKLRFGESKPGPEANLRAIWQIVRSQKKSH